MAIVFLLVPQSYPGALEFLHHLGSAQILLNALFKSQLKISRNNVRSTSRFKASIAASSFAFMTYRYCRLLAITSQPRHLTSDLWLPAVAKATAWQAGLLGTP